MSDISNMAEIMYDPILKEMMNNPEIMKLVMTMMNGETFKILEIAMNPDFIIIAMNNLKLPWAKPYRDAIAKQTGMSSETILKGLEWLVSLAHLYNRVRPVLSVIKYALIVLVVSYLLKWLGFL